MANLSAWFVFPSQLDAAQFTDVVRTSGHRIEAMEVRDGPKKGKWVIPARTATDPAFAEFAAAFAALEEIALDTDIAFPPQEEEDE